MDYVSQEALSRSRLAPHRASCARATRSGSKWSVSPIIELGMRKASPSRPRNEAYEPRPSQWQNDVAIGAGFNHPPAERANLPRVDCK